MTCERIASEAGRSRVWPRSAEYVGPHREGEEPKPMMHGHEKSDSVIVAVKPTNKAEQSASEPVEPRGGPREMRASKARAGRRAG